MKVKIVKISNPSAKPIAYSARLEGHPDFSLESGTIRVEPKATADFAVACRPTTTKPQVSPGLGLQRYCIWKAIPWTAMPTCPSPNVAVLMQQ